MTPQENDPGLSVSVEGLLRSRELAEVHHRNGQWQQFWELVIIITTECVDHRLGGPKLNNYQEGVKPCLSAGNLIKIF